MHGTRSGSSKAFLDITESMESSFYASDILLIALRWLKYSIQCDVICILTPMYQWPKAGSAKSGNRLGLIDAGMLLQLSPCSSNVYGRINFVPDLIQAEYYYCMRNDYFSLY